MIVCWGVFFLMKKFTPIVLPNYSKIPDHLKLELWNRGTASIHASLMFVLALIYWRSNPTYEVPDKISGFEAMTIDLMCG